MSQQLLVSQGLAGRNREFYLREVSDFVEEAGCHLTPVSQFYSLIELSSFNFDTKDSIWNLGIVVEARTKG
tara:strand:+ start:233 stop:445 length:213 start_codon:yes stop_codon:yes gene_type:complete